MKPAQSLIFLLSVGCVLLVFQIVLPADFHPFGYKLKAFNVLNWLKEKPAVASKLSSQKLLQLQSQTDALAQNDTTVIDSLQLGVERMADTTGNQITEIPAFEIDSASGIQYPAGDSTILYRFFANLDSLKSTKELIRILHFGDSQIEGDRITGYLRQRFQQQFGGCGPGLLPLSESIPSRFLVESKTDRQPDRYIIYGNPNPAPHSRYSVLHSLFRLKGDSEEPEKAVRQNFSYRLRNVGFKKATYFQKASLLCHNAASPIEISIKQKGQEGLKRNLPASDSLHIVDFQMSEKKTQLMFSLASSPANDFYGVCLDCPHGVAIDNIPLRGSSGLEFFKINSSFLREQIRQMNVKLIILQFGVNVIPYDAKNYHWYEASLVKTIQSLKRAAPDVQVLVVGVSDMARRKDGKWFSYPNITQVLEAQRNAAKRTNSAFWDLYQVMGGQNSIVAWANTTPPMAGKDFIHLTPKGAQVVAEFLYQAISLEFKKAKKTTNTQPS